MEMNYLASTVAALSTIVVGFVYYSKSFLGNAWMQANNLKVEDLKKGNMLKIFGFTIFFSFVLAFVVVPSLVFHQWGAMALVDWNMEDPALKEFFAVHGGKFLSFGHGALHGLAAGLTFVLPLFTINGLFQMRSWKAILIDVFYWIICLTIMGAIICGWH
jgi:Protein of unknown function (DUF1761)